MEAYREMLEALPIEAKRVFYQDWLILTLRNWTLWLLMIACLINVAGDIIAKLPWYTCGFAYWAIFIAYFAVMSIPYIRESKITGWKMDTTRNATVSSSPVLIAGLIILIAYLVHYALLASEIWRWSFALSAMVFALAIAYLLHYIRDGYGISREVSAQNISTLRAELFRKLRVKFPQAKIDRSAIKIGKLKILVRNKSTLSIEVLGLWRRDVAIVREIMEILD